jgi:amidase
VTGQPAIALPFGATDGGVPLGFQLVAGYGREDLLLRVAAQVEAARPWAHRIPPVHA